MSSYGEVNLSIIGLSAMLGSEAAEALRLVITQILLVGYKFHPSESIIPLTTAVVCACASIYICVRARVYLYVCVGVCMCEFVRARLCLSMCAVFGLSLRIVVLPLRLTH
jgi:hypothetical protein